MVSIFHILPLLLVFHPKSQSPKYILPSGPKSIPVGNNPLTISVDFLSLNDEPFFSSSNACIGEFDGDPLNSETKKLFSHFELNADPGLYARPVGPFI